MKKSLFLIITAIALLLTACDDNTDGIGYSLTDPTDNMLVSTAAFNVATESVKADSVCTRSTFSYLGKLKDPETDAYVTCNYMTQQRLQSYASQLGHLFAGIDSVIVTDDAGNEYTETSDKLKYVRADSCMLTLYIAGFKGDSLAPMNMTVHEMAKPYEEGIAYPTSFDPFENKYVRTDMGSLHRQRAYTISNKVVEKTGTYAGAHYITIRLDGTYIDKDGKFYDNYGSYLMSKYYNKPANTEDWAYYNAYTFLHDLCPGFYIEHTGGIGALAKITSSSLVVNYRIRHEKDSVRNASAVFAGTEETIQKSIVSQSAKLDDLVKSTDCTYIKSPAGIYTQLTLSIDSIMKDHEDDSLSTVRIFLPRINNTQTTGYTLSPPTTLLMVPTDSIDTFFGEKQVSDYRKTFLATYSSSNNGYTFTNISTLVAQMYKEKKEREASGMAPSNNWNKVLLVPVETSYTTIGTASVLTKVSHSMEVASTKLQRGTFENGKIKMSVIYADYQQ